MRRLRRGQHPGDRGEQGHPNVPPSEQLGVSSVGLSPPGSEPELTNSPGVPVAPCTRCLHPGLCCSNADAESEPGAVPGQQGASSRSDLLLLYNYRAHFQQ